MKISTDLQNEILKEVDSFLYVQEMEKFKELNERSFEAFTGCKFFDDLDPEERINYTYDYNLMNRFLDELKNFQERVRAERKKSVEVA